MSWLPPCGLDRQPHVKAVMYADFLQAIALVDVLGRALN
jgi:hypothetical protein